MGKEEKADKANDDSTESEKSVERKRRARTKRVADGIEQGKKNSYCAWKGRRRSSLRERERSRNDIRRRIRPDKPRITGCHLSAKAHVTLA